MKVEFYVMEDANRLQALKEVCLLAEQAYHNKETVYIHANSQEEAEMLDKLMWTFRDDSFLPHSLNEEDAAPVLIGFVSPAKYSTHTLVNLTAEIPAFYVQFERVIEVVYQDAAIQQAGRERFKKYREAGSDLHTHKMKVSTA